MPKIREAILIIIALICLCAAVYSHYRPRPQADTVYVEVEIPKEVMKVKTKTVYVDRIVVKVKKQIVKVLPNLPDSIKQNDNVQVTAVGDIRPYAGITRVAAVFDMGTGITSITAQRQQLPFFAFLNEKEVGFRYGLNGSSGAGFDIYGRWTFARVGSVFSSLYLEGNSNSQFKAMVMAGYRF